MMQYPGIHSFCRRQNARRGNCWCWSYAAILREAARRPSVVAIYQRYNERTATVKEALMRCQMLLSE